MKFVLFFIWAYVEFTIINGSVLLKDCTLMDVTNHPAKIFFAILWTIICSGILQFCDVKEEKNENFTGH